MTEGCEFRDLYEEFSALGVEIIGVSFDSVAENKLFSVNNNFQYELWSDLERSLGMFYGAAISSEQAFANRHTVVLDEYGRWMLTYKDVLNTIQHPNDVLSDLKAILN
jgi:peroxiredoxin Q/BCP